MKKDQKQAFYMLVIALLAIVAVIDFKRGIFYGSTISLFLSFILIVAIVIIALLRGFIGGSGKE
jgi:choline-glycine betaine transporter